MVPAAFGGMPGGMEIAVLFLILLSLAVAAVVLLAVGRRLFDGGGRRDADLESRVAELESEVAELRRELRERRDDR